MPSVMSTGIPGSRTKRRARRGTSMIIRSAAGTSYFTRLPSPLTRGASGREMIMSCSPSTFHVGRPRAGTLHWASFSPRRFKSEIRVAEK
jgi:hypothetical protein